MLALVESHVCIKKPSHLCSSCGLYGLPMILGKPGATLLIYVQMETQTALGTASGSPLKFSLI